MNTEVFIDSNLFDPDEEFRKLSDKLLADLD